MKTVFTVLFLSFIVFTSSGQTLELDWVGSTQGFGRNRNIAIAADVDNNIYALGQYQGICNFDSGGSNFTSISNGDYDIMLTKYNSHGKVAWTKPFGGTGNDQGYYIETDGNSNVYITGRFRNTVDFDPTSSVLNLTAQGSDDIFIAKYDSAGTFKWAKQIKSSSYAHAYAMDVDDSGNHYITGRYSGSCDFDPSSGTRIITSVGSYDAFVAKYDKNGNLLWVNNIGGLGGDMAYAISIDPQGQVIVGGRFEKTIDFDPSSNTVNLTPSNGFDMFLLKLTSTGSLNWVKSIEVSSGVYEDGPFALKTDKDGNIYHSGWFSNTTDFDPDANSTAILTSSGKFDIYASKLDSTGSFVWAKQIGGTSDEYTSGGSLYVGDNGDVYISGRFSGKCDFDPSTNTYELTSQGDFDYFLMSLDQYGVFKYAHQLGSSDYEIGTDVLVKGNKIFTCGAYSNKIDFDLSSGTWEWESLLDQEAFVACYTDTSITLSTQNSMVVKSEGNFIPNAFTPNNNDGLNETFKPIILENFSEFNMEVYSRWGQKVFESNNAEIGWDGTQNGAPMDQGVYFFHYSYIVGDVKKVNSGTVTLIR